MASDLQIDTSPVGQVLRPADPGETVILYLHSDRYLSSAPQVALDLASDLALKSNAVVVCARYRPVYPAALADVLAAYGYCQAWGPVAIAGEGLGAGLAAALLLHLRDVEATPPRGAVLVSGLLDLTMEAHSLLINRADPTFDVAELRRKAAHYAAGNTLTDPLLSPLHGNLHGLPPTQLLVAGTDPLLDDSITFAARAARSGVTVDLRVRPDEASLRRDAPQATADFIRSRLCEDLPRL